MRGAARTSSGLGQGMTHYERGETIVPDMLLREVDIDE